MDPLFIEQLEFEKTATTVLDSDSTKWTKQILDEFFTEFPFFMSQSVDLQYKKKDVNKGYAVGTINIAGLAIPIIVNNYQLSPFDIVYKDGIPLPLTDETLGALFKSESAFKGVYTAEEGQGSLTSLFEKPLVDLQPLSNFGKTASVIDRVSNTITAQHKKELLEKLSDEKVRAGFEHNNTVDILNKIAQVKPKKEAYFEDSLSKVLVRDIYYLEKVGRFNYRLIEGNSQVYDPVITNLTDSQIAGYSTFKAVGSEIEKKASYSYGKSAAFSIDGNAEKLLIMNTDGMRKYAYVSDIKPSSEGHCSSIFGGELPQIGDFGVWVDGNKASKPFEIVGMIKNARHYEINTFDGTSGKTYIPLRSVDNIVSHESQKNTYYMPTKYKFVKVGEAVDIERGPKVSFKYSNFYTKDDLGFYNLNGPVFSKYAECGAKTTSLTLPEASWAAIQCSASSSDVEKLATAPANIRIPFNSELKAPIPVKKVAALINTAYRDHSSKIKAIALDLVKEASTLADSSAVDAILSLNLVTKENILEFVHQLPLYEQVLSDLAKLLLTVRLGLPTVPEAAVERSMKGLSKIVEILRGMSNLEKVKK
jgi:hypothetical protein